MSAVPSPFAPRRGPRPMLRRGSIAFKKQWGTYEVLVQVEGRRKYVGSFTTRPEAVAAREHVYQERLSGRPIPTYRMTEEERSERARLSGFEARRRQLAALPPRPQRDPIVIPRAGKPIARCRCGLWLPCGSCIPTARDFAESRRDTD